jgi:prepilin-type N-terminal cleavage/methylation domain-containing protein
MAARARHRRGFTLIEILAVVAILALGRRVRRART